MKRIHFIAFNIMAAIFIITAVLGINGCHKNKSQTDYNILVIHSFDSLYTWPIPKTEMDANPQLAGQQNPGY